MEKHQASSCDKIAPYAFLSKLCWSKNVHEERDAPYQIQLGAMNSKHCVLLGLASWLEYFFEQGYDKKTEFAFGSEGDDCPYRINSRASDLLRTIFGSEDFVELHHNPNCQALIAMKIAGYIKSDHCQLNNM